jgi:hypothetical protein
LYGHHSFGQFTRTFESEPENLHSDPKSVIATCYHPQTCLFNNKASSISKNDGNNDKNNDNNDSTKDANNTTPSSKSHQPNKGGSWFDIGKFLWNLSAVLDDDDT